MDQPVRPLANEAICSSETITTLTKLLFDCSKYGFHLAPRSVRVDVRGEKRYQEIIKETYQKKVTTENAKTNALEDENEDQNGISTHENSMRDSRKPPEILQIEDEYNALT